MLIHRALANIFAATSPRQRARGVLAVAVSIMVAAIVADLVRGG